MLGFCDAPPLGSPFLNAQPLCLQQILRLLRKILVDFFHGCSKGVLRWSSQQPVNLQLLSCDIKEHRRCHTLYLFLLSNFFFRLGNDLLLLSEDHLDVARGAHVGVDAPMGPVGAPPHFGGLVDLDVLDDQRIHIQALGQGDEDNACNLFCIFQEHQNPSTSHSELELMLMAQRNE